MRQVSNPTHSDLGIEIGKAQAMAEAAQKAIQGVEKHLSDRMDRFEEKVDQRFTDLEKQFDYGLSEIKNMLQVHYNEITTIKIQASHEQGEKKHRNENRTTLIAVLAIIVSFLGAITSFLGSYLKH